MIATNEKDIEGLKKAGQMVAEIRETMKAAVKPGITTKELDELGGRLFKEWGGVSAPKSEYDFPGYTCISVNEEVAHGIPGKRVINDGDIVNIRCVGFVWRLFCGYRHFFCGRGRP